MGAPLIGNTPFSVLPLTFLRTPLLFFFFFSDNSMFQAYLEVCLLEGMESAALQGARVLVENNIVDHSPVSKELV